MARSMNRKECSARLQTPGGDVTEISYTLVRSDRKSLSLVVDRDGRLELRVPQRTPQREIDRVLRERSGWILQHMASQAQRAAERREQTPQMTQEEWERLVRDSAERLKPLLEERIRYFEPMLPAGHRPITRITIRDQKTRWGSCSAKGGLNFNWRLALVPEDCLDYVVVHELCHLVELNHSPAFWALVGSILPDWQESRLRLREYEQKLPQM